MKFTSLLKFEFSKYFKPTMIFNIVWILLIFLFMSFFDSISQNAAQLDQLYAAFPKEIMEIFGKSANSLSSIYGYFGTQIMLYIILSGCIFTVFSSANSISKEIGNSNILFLLSKPVSRLQIYFAKLVSIILNLVLSNFILFLGTILAIKIFTSQQNLDLQFFVLSYLALFILELFFLSIAQLIGMKLNNSKTVAISSLLVIVSYLLKILSGLSNKADALKYLSVNFYLDLQNLQLDKSLKNESFIVLIVSIGLIIWAGYLFKKRDIES